MKHWLNKNYRTLIITAFLIPIITVAVVSISHVTQWYSLSNPFTRAINFSIVIEIDALSELSAISANMGTKVYFPFAIVTLIQFIGNIFFSYTYIDLNSQQFIDWVTLVSPLLNFIGIEETDFIAHKRLLSLFAGGMLPLISLTFLHMLVKFTEEDRMNQKKNEDEHHDNLIDQNIIDEHVNKALEEYKKELESQKIKSVDLMSEISRVRLSEDVLNELEKILVKPPKTIEETEEHIDESEDGNDIRNHDIDPIIDNVVDDVVDITETIEEVVTEVQEELPIEEIVTEVQEDVSEVKEDIEKKNS